MKVTIIKAILSISVIFAITGCGEIQYKKYGEGMASRVGYSDFEISTSKYKVSYIGGVYDSPNDVMKNAYTRAKDLCKEKSYDKYIITNAGMSDKASSSSSQNYGSMRFSDSKSQTIYVLDVECK